MKRLPPALAATLLACSSFLLSQNSNSDPCPRPAIGSPVTAPPELRSHYGSLSATLSLRTSFDSAGEPRYCYIDAEGHQSPTLRVHPGDLVTLKLINDLPLTQSPPSAHHTTASLCRSANMTLDMSSATNLHFHGLSIPPTCHQDESLNTLVEPADSAFEYQFRIAPAQSPGLYWYHPHIHGNSEAQVLGGASGALIVEPIEGEIDANTEKNGREPAPVSLPERILIIRDQNPPSTDPQPRPAKDLSVNFVPIPYPDYPMAILRTRPSRRELWRLLNASADTYLDLGVLYNGKWRPLGLVAIDGAPLGPAPAHRDGVVWQSDIPIPPGGRAEFLLDTPAEQVDAELLTLGVDTTPPVDPDKGDEANPAANTSTPPELESDDANPPRQLVKIIADPDAADVSQNEPNKPNKNKLGCPISRILCEKWATMQPAPFESPQSLPAVDLKKNDLEKNTERNKGENKLLNPNKNGQNHTAQNIPTGPDLASTRPTRTRRFYFSEKILDPKHPATSTIYFITEQGTKPHPFQPNAAPDVTVRSGDVEDWIIENRSQESHAFHIHQLHFLTLQRDGAPAKDPYLRDTIDIPYWDGTSPNYPRVRLRMDFRDPAIIGRFPYHCHVLQHADAGMMAVIEVKPKK